MYKDLEELYKKKSPYNIIKKKMFLIYLLFVFISIFLNMYNKVISMIISFIIMIYCMKKVCEKALNTKLHLNIRKKKNNEEDLPLIIRNSEIELFKDYFIKKDLYNERSLLCIIDHYRSITKIKIAGGNLLAILSLVFPIVLSFYTKDGFDFNGLTNALPYLIMFIILIIIMYFSFNKLIEMKKLLKGEDGMIDRIEEILSELYIGYTNENKVILKSNSKQTIKKQLKKRNKASTK